MTEWQPISTAPKDGTLIIIICENSGIYPDVIAVRYLSEDKDGEAGWWDEYGVLYEPTYWIPMPKNPKKKHLCSRGTLSHEACYEDNGQLFLSLYNHSEIVKVDFCPFCGAKA